MIFKHIIELVEICVFKGVENVISSPGSRSAALTIAFAQHPKIKIKSISDERSAAFIALGMAKASQKPIVLICTSGTATLNYAPAIAEAYFQKIPLIVLTADRPPEWIAQQDGQTIFQNDIYGKNIKKSYLFPSNPTDKDELWYCNRIANEAISIATQFPKGPIHINIPFREPFYPTQNENIEFNNSTRIIEEFGMNVSLNLRNWNTLGKIINRSNNILLVAGMMNKNWKFGKKISEIPFPILTDITSNLHTCDNAITKFDTILQQNKVDDLKPDLLITFGEMILSKSLKLFLRNNKPKEHWHIQEAGEVSDAFQSITKIVRMSPSNFLSELSDYDFSIHSLNYLDFWRMEQALANRKLKQLFLNSSFNEFNALNIIFNNIYQNTVLHLANSMAVRYASILGTTKEIEIHSNRGTSGIDGCTSTALGFALEDNRINVIITGDVAFFYDRNAFWNNYIPSNLRIILLNNGGGGIFNLINGPKDQKEVKELFITQQTSTAKFIAKEYKLDYFVAENNDALVNVLSTFFNNSSTSKILEIKTKIEDNTAFFDLYKN